MALHRLRPNDQGQTFKSSTCLTPGQNPHALLPSPAPQDADGRAVQAEPTAADKAAEQPRSKRVAGVQEGEAGPAAPAEAAAEGEQERAAPADLQAELQAELPHQPPPKKRKHEREREERESGTEGEGAPPMAAAHAGAPRASSLAGSGED